MWAQGLGMKSKGCKVAACDEDVEMEERVVGHRK